MNGFTAIPSSVLNNQGLSIGALKTYGQLVDIIRPKKKSKSRIIGSRYLAERVGISRRQVWRYLRELQKNRLVREFTEAGKRSIFEIGPWDKPYFDLSKRNWVEGDLCHGCHRYLCHGCHTTYAMGVTPVSDLRVTDYRHQKTRSELRSDGMAPPSSKTQTQEVTVEDVHALAEEFTSATEGFGRWHGRNKWQPKRPDSETIDHIPEEAVAQEVERETSTEDSPGKRGAAKRMSAWRQKSEDGSDWKTSDLSGYFFHLLRMERAAKRFPKGCDTRVSVKTLQGTMSRLLKDGVSPELVKFRIDYFFTNFEQIRSPKKPNQALWEVWEDNYFTMVAKAERREEELLRKQQSQKSRSEKEQRRQERMEALKRKKVVRRKRVPPASAA